VKSCATDRNNRANAHTAHPDKLEIGEAMGVTRHFRAWNRLRSHQTRAKFNEQAIATSRCLQRRANPAISRVSSTLILKKSPNSTDYASIG
jgi:hypothetical protein